MSDTSPQNQTQPAQSPSGKPPPRKNTRRATNRSAWWWHFWAGLLVAPIMLVASITGAVLVFDEEIRLAFDREWNLIDGSAVTLAGSVGESERESEQAAGLDDEHPSFSDRLSLDELVPLAESAARSSVETGTQTDAPLSSVYVFSSAERNVTFVFRDGPFDRRTITRVAIDPYTGRIAGIRNGESGTERFLRVMLTIHESIFAGIGGRFVVELVTAWGFVLVLSGLLIWWPRSLSTIAGVWTVRHRGPRYRRWRDWHSVPAAYFAVPAALVLFTGLLLSVGTGGVWTLGAFATGGIPEAIFSPPPIEGPKPAQSRLEPALQHARAIRPDAPLYDIALPYDERAPISGVAGSAAEPLGTQYVFVHPESGALISSLGQADIPLHGQPVALAYGVHTGGIGGMPTKIIAVLVCLGLVASTITGVVMWLIRRPAGTLGRPKPAASRPAVWYILGAAGVGVLAPTFGLSLLVILFGRTLVRAIAGRRPVGQPV